MGKMQVLIIDDDRDIAGFFDAVLSLIGHECETVQSAREALVRLAASDPDLILLDLHLGSEISGEDILYQVRSNPRFDNTRVVVITGYPNHAEMITNLADLVLIKPVEVSQLKTLVERMGSYEIGPKRSSFRDPVTQLFNREYFISRVELAFDRAQRRPDFQFAVTAVQIGLEGVSEQDLSPEAWVNLLREISERLKSHLRPMDAIAKFSGWKFGVLNEELTSPENIPVIIRRLQESIIRPIEAGSQSYYLNFSFGSALYNRRFKRAMEMLDSAEKDLENARPLAI